MKRIHGRYTLYGEFLMHECTWGYVAPVPMALTDGEPNHPCYCPEDDEVAALLSRMGLHVLAHVGGDLPLGRGFASSTALALLHLGDQVDASLRPSIVRIIDWIHHGFMPSGLDYFALTTQSPGFYLAGNWESAPALRLNIAFVEVPPGPRRLGALTRAAVSARLDQLAPLADRMTCTIRENGEVNIDVLAAYADCLLGADVYSPDQRALIEAALAEGVIAKGIGGLYNKAILLAGELDEVEAFLAGRDEVRLDCASDGVRLPETGGA